MVRFKIKKSYFLIPLYFLLGCKESPELVGLSDLREERSSVPCTLFAFQSWADGVENIKKSELELKENYKISVIKIVDEKEYKITLEENADLDYAVFGLKDYQIVLQDFIKDDPYRDGCDEYKKIAIAKNNAVNDFLKINTKKM